MSSQLIAAFTNIIPKLIGLSLMMGTWFVLLFGYRSIWLYCSAELFWGNGS